MVSKVAFNVATQVNLSHALRESREIGMRLEEKELLMTSVVNNKVLKSKDAKQWKIQITTLASLLGANSRCN